MSSLKCSAIKKLLQSETRPGFGLDLNTKVSAKFELVYINFIVNHNVAILHCGIQKSFRKLKITVEAFM